MADLDAGDGAREAAAPLVGADVVLPTGSLGHEGSTPPVLIPPPEAMPSGLQPAVRAPQGHTEQLGQRILDGMHRALVGQDELIEMLTVALLANGHVLLEGVPGTAKTLSIRVLARLLDLSFSRIQFTPDMMPSDILGTSIFDPRTQQFNFREGPVFSSLVLADEINRTPPKTQSALLEAMEERRVTIDGMSHGLPIPFLVCATQNPIEYEGTYPLPEAQLDRFMLKVKVDYPAAEEELGILERVQGGFRAQHLELAGIDAVTGVEELQACWAEVDAVKVDETVQRYIVEVCRATRQSPYVVLGASPRAAITLMLTAKALAAMSGRDFATPDDVKTMAPAVLRHRVLLRAESEIEGHTADEVVERVLSAVLVPR